MLPSTACLKIIFFKSTKIYHTLKLLSTPCKVLSARPRPVLRPPKNFQSRKPRQPQNRSTCESAAKLAALSPRRKVARKSVTKIFFARPKFFARSRLSFLFAPRRLPATENYCKQFQSNNCSSFQADNSSASSNPCELSLLKFQSDKALRSRPILTCCCRQQNHS